MNIPQDTIAWLMEAPEPYIRYQVLRLLNPDEADPALLDTDPFIAENIKIISGWRKAVLERHDKPDLFIHRLAMLADLGVTRETKGVGRLVDALLDNIDEDGSFLINISIPKAFGGSGNPSREWIICDFPVIVYALLRMGIQDNRLSGAVNKLINLAGDNYYPCCGSIPKFKGPGPRGGMCPYANLLVARALSASPEGKTSKAAALAAGAVLGHWSDRKEKKYYLFGMGTDFKKLKFPMVWYNLLHVASALIPIDSAATDPRFSEMMALLEAKPDDSGRVKPESIYMCYKTHEWGNKKIPSRLLTVLTHRLLETYKK